MWWPCGMSREDSRRTVSASRAVLMSGINVQRVILGGLVAGLVANVFDFVITSYLMDAEFARMMERANMDPQAGQSWIWVFAITDFIWGILLVFTYASIRPRFGPGAKTATIAGIMLWAVVAIVAVLFLALGLHTLRSYLESAALYLVSAVVASLAGAALYNEHRVAT